MLHITCPSELAECGFAISEETAEDLPFLRELFAEDRAGLFAMLPWDQSRKDALIAQQFELQHKQLHDYFPLGRFLILRAPDGPVGRIYLTEMEEAEGAVIHIVDILLIARWRGQGLGTLLMQAVQDSAKRKDCAVTLTVGKENSPAFGFYHKLGFVIAGQSEIDWSMRWQDAA